MAAPHATVPRPAWLAELRALIQTVWQVPGSKEVDAALLRGDQWREVLKQLPVAVLATLLLIALTLSALGDRMAPAPLVALLTPLLILQCGNLALWWRERSRPTDAPCSPTAAVGLGLDLGLAGLLGAGVIVHALSVADDALRLVLVGGAAAVVAAAAWMFALLPAAGLGWLAGVTLGLMAGIVLFPLPALHGLLPLLPLFALALALSILLNARQFLRGRLAQHALARQSQVVTLLLADFESHASDWLWEVDAEGCLRQVSRRLAERLGEPVQRLVGRPLISLLRARLPAGEPEAEALLGRLSRAFNHNAGFRDLDVQVNVGGRHYWWCLRGRRLDGRTGWRGMASDVTELREREQALQRLASVDALTGLANRDQFRRRLALHLSGDASQEPCTLVLLNLAGFKQINDSLGHAAGDQLLTIVAERLRESVLARRGPDDLIARLGADEFGLVLRGELEPSSIQRLVKQLRSALAVPVTLEQHQLDIAASYGAARAPSDATSPEQLLRAADLALHAAKTDGRNRLRAFEPALLRQASERAALLSELRRAIETEQFELHYQPQIDLSLGTLRGFEALLRWRHPERGLVSPAVFVPLAEDAGLIMAIGAWVMRRACRDAASWPAGLTVSVNVSAVEFERSPVEQQVLEALRDSGLPPARLEVELTESALLQDSERGIVLLQRLRKAGVRVALDDFGTGFSSLSYLRRLPLDQLKIDRAFVMDLDRPSAAAAALAIITAIHNLAQALGLETVAEGIETLAQHEALVRLGCQVGQGYLYARPLPLPAARQFIQHVGELGLDEAVAALRRAVVAPPAAPALPAGARRLANTNTLPDARWVSGR